MEKNPLINLIPFMNRLSQKEISDFMNISRKKTYKKNSIIFNKGDKSNHVLALLSGSARVITSSIDGREFIINFIEAGHIFGELAAIDKLPHTATVITTVQSDALIIKNDDFIKFIKDVPNANQAILEKLAYTIRSSSDAMENFAFHSIKTRLLKKITALAGDKKVIVFTQDELAKMLAVSREKVNSGLQEIQAMGLIKILRGKIEIISPDAINDYLLSEGIDV